MMAWFSRILSESDDKNLSMKKTGSQIDKIQQAFSVVNTNITEVLLGTSFEALFEQIARYNRYIEHFDPIDWKLFVTHRNKLRFTNQSLSIDNTLPFEDEKTEEEKQREAEEEKKREDEEEAKIVQEAEEGNARDKVELAIEKQTNKELKKLNSIYDEKIILKLLRLIEMFTSIALKNSHIHQFVLKVTRPVQIKTLVHLLINCQSKHGIMTLKILTNLLKIGIDKNTLDNSFIELKEMEVVREIFELNTKVKFEEWAFIQFCYNYLLKIRSSQWDKRAIESNGAYIISCSVVRLLRTILVTTYQPKWKAKIEEAMDAFIADIDSYPIEEFDVMLSLFEGGEYNGLNTGAYGKTAEGNKFITAGFVKNWYDLSTPDGSGSSSNFEIKDVTADIKTKDDYLLAIYFDENNPQRNDMFLAVPDQVNPISYLTNESDKYLLNKDRLSNFLKAMELDKVPDKNSIESLSKRWVGIKILINQIEIHGDEIAKLLDDSFRDSFINFLLTECTNKDEKKDSIKYEWYDQKLYALKKYATENQVGMNASNDNSVIFNGKLMSVSTIIRDTHESYYEWFPLTSVMNYGCITQKKTYNLIDSASVGITRYRNDNAVILKSSEVDTAEKILEIFKHVEVLITSDLDLKDIHDKIKQLGDNTTTYFRSIIVIGHREFESLLWLVSEGPKVKVPETSSLNSHDAFCKELEVFCNYQRETLDEIFVGKETANLPEKIKLLVQHSSKAEKKEEEKKEEKKKEDESFNSVTDGISKLINHENLRTNLNELANFQNSNYTSSSNEVKDQKGDLFTKIYNINSNEVMGNYKSSLVGLYQQSWKKTLSSFFDRISIDKLIDITLVSEESTEKLIQYIQLRGNDAVTLFKQTNNRIVYDNFLKLFKKIIEICSNNEKYNKVLDVIFKKSILLGTCNALKQANKNKNKYIKDTFNSEESALMSLNTFLIPDALKYILQERPVLIYDPAEFSNLMSVLLMIPITFREEKEFHKRIYMTLYKLILPFVQKPKDYNNLDIIKSILTHPFLKDLFGKFTLIS